MSLVERTARIAAEARAATPTRAQLHAEYPELAAWIEDLRAHGMTDQRSDPPCWMEMRLGKITLTVSEEPPWSKNGTAVQASPSFVLPARKRKDPLGG